MRKLSIIGIGAGSPDYITVQAIKALSEIDVIFLIDKGSTKSALTELRKELLRQSSRSRRFDHGSQILGDRQRVFAGDLPARLEGAPNVFSPIVGGATVPAECGRQANSAPLLALEPLLRQGCVELPGGHLGYRVVDEARAPGRVAYGNA